MAQPHPLHVLTVGWLHACRHTFTHPDLADVTDNVFRSQMHDAQAAIESAICVKPRFMRPPYGSLPKAKQELVESMGYKAVTWNLNVEDWKYARENREKLVDSVLNATNRYPESIVQLQHDWYEESVSVVAQMVDAIRGAGYRLVTMDECAYGKGACVNRTAGRCWCFTRGHRVTLSRPCPFGSQTTSIMPQPRSRVWSSAARASRRPTRSSAPRQSGAHLARATARVPQGARRARV